MRCKKHPGSWIGLNGPGYCQECAREREAKDPSDAATCSALRELIENLEEWANHFRQNQHGATLSILRAKKLLAIQSARIGELEDAINQIFHYTDCTTGQMTIIEAILPQNAGVLAHADEKTL